MSKEITVVKPSVEIITEENPALKLEMCMRVCYKSEGKICEGSADKIIKKIIERGHTSTLEHVHLRLKGYRTSVGDCQHSVLSHYIGISNNEYVGNVRAWLNYLVSAENSPSELDFTCDVECALKNLYPELFKKVDNTISPYFFEIEPVMTVRFVCDRGVSHELVRHRVASFSQESTRYCDYSGAIKFIKPCFKWAKPIIEGTYSVKDLMVVNMGLTPQAYPWLMAMDYANKCYNHMIKEGCSPQEARAVLPNSLKTELIMTATYDQWVEIFKLRLNPAAHPQAQEVMLLLKQSPDLPEELKK